MFQELLISGARGTTRTHKRWAIAGSAVAQSAIWGVLIVVPLLYTEALPNGMLKMLIVAPPEPEAPTAATPPKNKRTRIIPLSHVTAPAFVPRHINSEAGEPLVEYVDRENADATGQNDSLTDLFRSPKPPAPIAPAEKETARSLVIGGSVEEASLINRVLPHYPEIARLNHVSGTVALSAIIARDGTVRELAYVSGPALLIKPAMDAVRQWRYRPTLLDGSAVEVETTIDVVFSLGN